jgi:hypothetical protein
MERRFEAQTMRVAAITLLGLLLFTGCSQSQSEKRGDLCLTNFALIREELRPWTLQANSFPSSFNEFHTTNLTMFVCPGSGHAAGSMTNVADWTDYIYLDRAEHISQAILIDVAILICPPENHGGKYGHVLFGDQSVRRLPADQIRALIKAPWCMSNQSIYAEHRAPPFGLRVPPYLRSLYGIWDNQPHQTSNPK